MYIRIRKLGTSQEDAVINISKMVMINELRKLIEERFGVEYEQQMLLYKGKQLIDDHRVMDYDIQLNDIIQLMIRPLKQPVDKEQDVKIEVSHKEITVDAKSKYYKIGDLIDVRLPDNGAWYEAIITRIFKKNRSNEDEGDLMFTVKGNEHVAAFEVDVLFNDIRLRSYYTYKISELEKGLTVLVNYNIEDNKARGVWYDFKIDELSRNTVKGTILVGCDQTPIENCCIKFINEIMRIEKLIPLSERNVDNCLDKSTLRKYPYNCEKCKDVNSRKCKECGCRICAGKDSCDTMILCDECDYGYHIACLNPPLTTVPKDDEWYCPECKTDVSEIVRAGEQLKISKKKYKMASNKGESSRDWGKGMACVGRTKECTIVPKDHYGPIPGIEVGTCWKFRLQVSEAGIHRPHVAGIHGRETDGAYSLVLSGGYEDDLDNGIEFLYTGSGGRDLSGNKRINDQSSDQKLTRMNKALALNCNAPFNDKVGAESKDWKKGKPVRVVRNYKGSKHSKYSPKDGNRYDGIYKVVKYYPEKGKSGFIVWRYLLKRDDPTPAPWEKEGGESPIIYPPGYLEAQAQQIQDKRKDKENGSKSPGNVKCGSKRKTTENSKPLTDFYNYTPAKKVKVEYIIPDNVLKFINEDKANEKLWTDCKNIAKEGKEIFFSKVEEAFMCVCCQELVYEPITTECKHNVCKSCLRRSFSSEIYSCPCCRQELGKTFKMNVNENLGKSLQILFSGYEAKR